MEDLRPKFSEGSLCWGWHGQISPVEKTMKLDFAAVQHRHYVHDTVWMSLCKFFQDMIEVGVLFLLGIFRISGRLRQAWV